MNRALFEDDEADTRVRPDSSERTRVCDAVEKYLAKYRPGSSIRSKKKAASKTLLASLAAQGIVYVDEISRAAMTAHLNFLKTNVSAATGKVLAEGTWRDYTVIMRHLLRYFLEEAGLQKHIYYSYELASIKKPSIYVATDLESLLVLSAADWFWDEVRNPGVRYVRVPLRKFHRAKMRLILCFAISLGLRIGETCNISLRDYNRELRQITLPLTKAGKERIVPVSDTLAHEIEAWLRVRPKKATTEFMLMNENGEKLQPQAVTRMYRRYLAFVRTQGVELPNITMHSHRHKALTAIVKENPRHAQIIAGHGSITTTINNYDHQVAEDVRETYEKADALKRVMSQVKSTRKPRGRKVA